MSIEYSRPSSPSVKSDYSLSNHPLLSTSSSEHNIPRPIRNITGSGSTHVQHVDDDIRTQSHPLSAPVTDARSAPWNQSPSVLAPLSPRHLHAVRPSSRFSERGLQPSIHEEESVDDEDDDEAYDAFGDPDLTINVREAIASAPPFTRPTSVASFIHEPVHAIATPRPTLIFAIASDNVEEVRRVLQTGEASPNDDVGPQSALAFALTSNQLKHKAEMVKLLLAHGADPSSLKAIPGHSQQSSVASVTDPESEHGTRSSNPVALADPATRYYIARAEAPQTRRTSALIHRSFFRPLAKVRYEMIGQDRALEQLFRVLSMPAMAPIVVLLCGPSGHGKSLLARRFGSLLDVPTHTVNMTTLRSTHDIWRSYSMSPYEAPSALTLADFLMENEGKRCVVVLDEIEKTENDKVLSSLLMPWELGRCSFEAGHRHVDVSKVIWLGTSNIGHDLVFEHHSSRASPDETMSREEYVDLMGLLRPIVSDRLGPSVLSRVTTVLPFVSFTTDEKLAIAAEALFALAEDAASTLPAATVEKLVRDSLRAYMPAEGARSLYRAVSTQLLETL
ncbi:P-loop containing nucleoside triphosphate hydrolase protein [Trametopsis cervina]|nr:P-loop containing nucleoside triphosphate hydrolase protein [Trametopsis cervina]